MGSRANKLFAARLEALPCPEKSWRRWVLSGGGVGYLRPAPGSWGTVPPALAFWLMLGLGVGEPWRTGGFLLFGLLAGAALVALGQWGCAYFREVDPHNVVLDEYAGFAVTCAFVNVTGIVQPGDWWGAWLVTAGMYLLFRLTDTLKLPPGRQLEQLPWGWGILLDDIAAGVQANVVVHLVLWVGWGNLPALGW